ncbi:serine/threonine-protein kinase Chk1-like [Oratosquilla oratoria]|uniref:serine/threonine-protein kinase Chk1-like n=1 Tax=Oratosquilla oratoria TaxID=337810 RepID=UPI003F7779AB
MFFKRKYSRLQEENLDTDTTAQSHRTEAEESKKSFWKVLLRCSALFCCLRRNSSGKETKTVVKSPGKKLLRKNRTTARMFTNTQEWTNVQVLGEGTYGRVVLAQNAKNGDVVAKKTVPVNPKFTEEIIHFQLKHPNLINLFCWERSDLTQTMYMEYCSGGDLQSIIDTLSTTDALEYFSQLMQGVDYIHSRGVVHRDIKPANLLLTEAKVLKITDFGLSDVFVVKGKEVHIKGIMGTRAYMAPEILQDPSYLGPPVDLWACGIIFVQMMGRVRPWKQAAFGDECYQMWTENYPKLKEMIPWRWICDSTMTTVNLLLERDPGKRLAGWRNFWKE